MITPKKINSSQKQTKNVNGFSSTKLLYILDILVISVFFLFLFLCYKISKGGIKTFTKDFDNGLISYIALAVIVMYIFFFCIYYLLTYLRFRTNLKFKWWVINTVGIMLLTLVVGIVIIHSYLGPKNLSLVLRENGSRIVGNLTCSDNSGKLMAENELYCNIYPNLTDLTASVTLTNNNGKKETQKFNDLRFKPREDTEHLFFSVKGTDETNKVRYLTVGYKINFLTSDEEKDRSNNYLYALFILLGIVLFSVPNMMVNFKELWRDH